MRNFVKEGDVIAMTAPRNVVSGDGMLVGLCFGVATGTALSGAVVEAVIEGVVTLPKVTGTAINEGVRVFWDNTAFNVTTVTTGNLCIGVAVGPGNYASGATSINVKLSAPNALAA
jgi:predicted RecA/RadA family phage recombinase